MTKKPVALVCTVWGRDFTDFFSRYTLASLLAPGNLPDAARSCDFTLLLYIARDDYGRLSKHDNFLALQDIAEVTPVFLEELPPNATKGHWIQWQSAVTKNHAFYGYILIIPDCVYGNFAIQNVLKALETADIIYYSLPQVCIELIRNAFDSMCVRAKRNGKPHTVLNVSEHDTLRLFIDYINPKHAAARERPLFFMEHPEYFIANSAMQLCLTEQACHPLALRGDTAALSYTFNPVSEAPSIGFCGILGVSCEYTLKFIDQYYRWSNLSLGLSRLMNLASWSYTFREKGAAEYSKTATRISIGPGGGSNTKAGPP